MPADVLWALAHRRRRRGRRGRRGRRANDADKVGRQIRLDLHLDVLRFLPVKAQVDGKERGSESTAFIGTLEAAG